MNDSNLRQALGSFVSGITVITSIDSAANPVGVTVSSFCSLSLEPPMVLWCLAKNARSADIFTNAPYFVANVLAHDQWHVAELFATKGADKFGRTSWDSSPQGIPLIAGCVSQFECSRDSVHDGGDHLIVTGRIDSYQVQDLEPLAYHRGRYALTHMDDHAANMMTLQSW